MAGSASEPSISSSSWATIWARMCGVAAGGFGVEADHEPLMVADPDFLDPHVRGDFGVAALAGQRGGDLGRSGAQFLPDDVVVITRSQVAAVLR